MNDTFECRKCGYENPLTISRCLKCNQKLRNLDYYKDDYKEFYRLFCEDNLDLLKHSHLSVTGYDFVLNNIVNINQPKVQIVPLEPTVENIMNTARAYVNILYDDYNRYPRFMSYYSYNNIFINRNNTRHKDLSTSILHELSHHLFNEIFKQILMHLLNIDKTLLIESFVWYLTLNDEYIHLANEYQAHKVQDHFFPDEKIEYTSVIDVLEQNPDLEEDKITSSLSLGNTISKDIIFILEHFIAPKQAMLGLSLSSDGVDYDVYEVTDESKIESIETLIKTSFKYVFENKFEMLNILSDINNKYIEFNL